MSEILDIVDEDDLVLGQNTRHESYRNKTINRVISVIILNSDGEVDEVKFFSLSDLRTMIEFGGELTPGTIKQLKKYYLK